MEDLDLELIKTNMKYKEIDLPSFYKRQFDN